MRYMAEIAGMPGVSVLPGVEFAAPFGPHDW